MQQNPKEQYDKHYYCTVGDFNILSLTLFPLIQKCILSERIWVKLNQNCENDYDWVDISLFSKSTFDANVFIIS